MPPHAATQKNVLAVKQMPPLKKMWWRSKECRHSKKGGGGQTNAATLDKCRHIQKNAATCKNVVAVKQMPPYAATAHLPCCNQCPFLVYIAVECHRQHS
jgi:hypothetical protein